MKKYFILLFCLFLPGCIEVSYFQNQKVQNLAVQVYADSPLITAAINELSLKINAIVKEELGLAPDYDFTFFIPKKRQRITLYYVTDIAQENNPLLISALERLHFTKKNFADVHARSHVEFFGECQDELVIVIDDKEGELTSVNQQIKLMAHHLNDGYKKQHDQDLYDIEKSERFSFVPHMGLGRIRLGSIRNHMQDKNVLERIKRKIKDTSREHLQQLIAKYGSHLHFYRFGLLDLWKQIYLKEWQST